MSLTLHFHPLASFCHKALVAFYENDIPFDPVIVDLGEPTSRAAFLKLWPIGKMPLLQDHARDRIVPESSIIIEYLDQHYPGPMKLVPVDPEQARQTRLSDRFFDLYVQVPMQTIVTDRIRPAGQNDPHGVEAARTQLETALGMVEHDMQTKPWAMGESFTMADCAAAPALFYADKIMPLAGGYPNANAYLGRLMARPSVARVYKEAEPYFKKFPR